MEFSRNSLKLDRICATCDFINQISIKFDRNSVIRTKWTKFYSQKNHSSVIISLINFSFRNSKKKGPTAGSNQPPKPLIKAAARAAQTKRLSLRGILGINHRINLIFQPLDPHFRDPTGAQWRRRSGQSWWGERFNDPHHIIPNLVPFNSQTNLDPAIQP